MTMNGMTRESVFPKSDQFAPELLYFSDCILKDREPEPSGQEGLADVRIIQSLYESIESGKLIKLTPAEIVSRPSVEQEIHRPAVIEPELVHAHSPSR